MLNLVLGRNGSGKTEYLRNIVAQGVSAGETDYIIIVPEQFSYETERDMLQRTGAANMLNIEVLSLSRLADIIIEKYNKKSDKLPVDDGIRLITMSQAIESLGEKIKIYSKYISRPVLIQNLITFATELKQCDVNVDELKTVSDSLKDCSLKSKLNELTLIVSLYNSILSGIYFDSSDSLTLLYEILCEKRFFENRTVVIDAFTRFTQQELKIIEKIICQSKNVYMSFCTDEIGANKDDFSLFANVTKQVEIIKSLANKNNVPIAKPVLLKAEENSKCETLFNLEKNFMRNRPDKFDVTVDNSITIASAGNINSECEYVACKIKSLLREKSERCKDIIVFERTKDSYDKDLCAAFKKFEVPFYEDKRQPIETQPLIVYIRSLLEISCSGVSTETLMKHLKSGLSSLEEDDISELENYAFIWKINSTQWAMDFTENPSGFGVAMSDFDKERLAYLNELRRKAIAPVLAFRRDFRQAVGSEKTKVLYNHLVTNNVSYRLKELALVLSNQGNTALYEEQDNVWSIVMEMLEKLYLATSQGNVSPKRFSELFDLLLSVTDLGTLPQGLDAVTIGAADRTRTSSKKYVFVIGANDGVFPLNPPTQGLLNDNERIRLRSLGIELAQTAEYKITEEKFIAYSAVTTATDGLYITYSTANYQGETLTPSSIVSCIKTIYPNVNIQAIEEMDDVDRIESDVSAFEVLAENYGKASELRSSLVEYFKANESYSGRLKSLERAVNKTVAKIENTDIAKDLFGKNMYVSASKTDVYYKCPFQYFCHYGLKAEPRQEATIDPRLSGTTLHYIFEIMLSKFTKEQLLTMSDKMLKNEINAVLEEYLEENMGGAENKSKRFINHYNNLLDQAYSVMKKLIDGMEISDFIPVDFELSINKDGEVLPYVIDLDNACSLTVSGYVDRVDVMDKDGKKYLRVIDYKTGGKTFKLSDVLYGLNAQMLIYLFAIEANGKKKYGQIIPSGVLYMQAGADTSTLGRNATQEDISRLRMSNCKMKGIVLDDIDVVLGMEKDGEGKFIPAGLDKQGNVKGDVISSSDLTKVKKRIDSILKNMAVCLQNGEIPVLPTGKDTCKYCQYNPICGYEQGDKIREIVSMKNDEVIAQLNCEEVSDCE